MVIFNSNTVANDYNFWLNYLTVLEYTKTIIHLSVGG